MKSTKYFLNYLINTKFKIYNNYIANNYNTYYHNYDDDYG